jgi:hypothetical protein
MLNGKLKDVLFKGDIYNPVPCKSDVIVRVSGEVINPRNLFGEALLAT